MIPRLSGDCEGRERIRRNNSVKYYGSVSENLCVGHNLR
jgi:hypothetical protein